MPANDAARPGKLCSRAHSSATQEQPPPPSAPLPRTLDCRSRRASSSSRPSNSPCSCLQRRCQPAASSCAATSSVRKQLAAASRSCTHQKSTHGHRWSMSSAGQHATTTIAPLPLTGSTPPPGAGLIQPGAAQQGSARACRQLCADPQALLCNRPQGLTCASAAASSRARRRLSASPLAASSCPSSPSAAASLSLAVSMSSLKAAWVSPSRPCASCPRDSRGSGHGMEPSGLCLACSSGQVGPDGILKRRSSPQPAGAGTVPHGCMQGAVQPFPPSAGRCEPPLHLPTPHTLRSCSAWSTCAASPGTLAACRDSSLICTESRQAEGGAPRAEHTSIYG